jgi:heterodisulfide reductase subunit A-like polyferredoxin
MKADYYLKGKVSFLKAMPGNGRMKALVVGAGIAGLSAAIGLRGAGYRVETVERATQPRGLGAGLSLWPNALEGRSA